MAAVGDRLASCELNIATSASVYAGISSARQ
jgi:hypothetical protein